MCVSFVVRWVRVLVLLFLVVSSGSSVCSWGWVKVVLWLVGLLVKLSLVCFSVVISCVLGMLSSGWVSMIFLCVLSGVMVESLVRLLLWYSCIKMVLVWLFWVWVVSIWVVLIVWVVLVSR